MTRLFPALSAFALAACSSTTLDVSFEGLEPLGEASRYEGWLIVDGAPVSIGVFDVEEGQTDFTFEVARADADAATDFVLTLEPAEDDDPAPSESKLVGGALLDGEADLSVDHVAAIGDLAYVAGQFILATPTSSSTDDEAQGIWYLDPTAGPDATLDLPDLGPGWTYEGWIVGDDG